MLPRLRALFFATGGGREPVREWLMSLSSDERKRIGTDIAYVQFLAEARWKEWHDAEGQ